MQLMLTKEPVHPIVKSMSIPGREANAQPSMHVSCSGAMGLSDVSTFASLSWTPFVGYYSPDL